ncbi:helix-turn-helix domain-containing protein [Paenibacillus dendritiformis]|uniref:hypothetical protein n=1 Tax=Paenibacillus dendritiformis TaxID=130049 RepID=UPI00387E1C66
MMWMDEKEVLWGSPDIRIGIIGPEAMMGLMEHCLKGFPSFDPVMRSYRQEEEAPDLARELAEKVDVLLFTGPVSYQLAKNQHQFDIPSLFVPLTGSGLYAVLFRLERKLDVAAITVDTLSRQMLVSTFRELGHLWTAYEGEPLPSWKELVEFHRGHYEAGRSCCAITAIRSVSLQLAREGIPCEWIVPTEQDIIVTLERALLSTEWRRNKEGQVVVGLIRTDGIDRLAERQVSEHEIQRLKQDVHHLILSFVKHLDGHITQQSSGEYSFVTTRGVFERETGGYKRIPLARNVHKMNGIHLSIGIGFGRSAAEAGVHARRSLQLACEGGGGMCFIVREDESVIGPLEINEPHELDLSLVDAALVKQAETAGLTSIYLSRLIAHMTRFGKVDYYAQELATVLGVTVRSVHRFLLALMDAGLVDIVGEEKGASRGRPRQKYRISFLSRLIR